MTRPAVLVATLCLAHLLMMLGFSAFPALLPLLSERWSLSGTEAGAINSALFAGYTLAVPVLVSLTDRIDIRKIYVASALTAAMAHLGFALLADSAVTASLFSALYGLGLAGTYMPGLRLMGEYLPAATMARATGYYTAMFSLGAASSYVLADRVAATFGWPSVFAVAGACAALAMLIVASLMRKGTMQTATDKSLWSALDPRPALRNRSALAYSLCYGLHTLELMTVRSWVVGFLVVALAGHAGEIGFWQPALVAALLTVLGVAATISGNEMAIRIGRRRWIVVAMTVSAALAIATGVSVTTTYWLCATLAVLHGFAIMVDSATLTAGAFGSAQPQARGITMAVHSTIGFAGAVVGPLLFGALVDGLGSEESSSWSIAYSTLALVGVAGIATLAFMKPAGLSGDRG